ncbi:MAG: radical SAM protein [Candidatus Omnitrophota bacterium]|nr:radical SAM protein [Candidatus Omnitrophota bacterium]
MDLLIINTRIMWFSHKSMIATGPLVLASYLHEKGFSTGVIDDNSVYKRYRLKDYVDFIERNDVKMIGFSVNTLNAYNSYELAKALRKKFPDKPLLAGGLQSFDAIEEMEQQSFDVIFKGEAEIASAKFMAAAKKCSPHLTRAMFRDSSFMSELAEIQGLHINVDGRKTATSDGFCELVQDLDDVPFSNYDLINLSDYIKSKFDHHSVTNQLNFQRGCPYACTFCKSAVIAQKLRNNSAHYMISELERRYEKFGLSNFFITDSNFTIDKARVQEFCAIMISKGLNKKINLMIQTSIVIPLSDDEIDLLQEAGVTMFAIGVERLGEGNRKQIKKAGSGTLATTLIRKLYDRGMRSMVNILVNLPFDSEETMKEETGLITKNLPYVGFLYINYLWPMPGTPICDDDTSSKYKAWYLDKNIAGFQVPYYSYAFLLEGALALDVNIFGHSKKTLRAIRRFKEEFQWKGTMGATRLPLLKVLFAADMFLGKISYFVGRISPKLEHFVFAPFKFLRIRGYKIVFNFFMGLEKKRANAESNRSVTGKTAKLALSKPC